MTEKIADILIHWSGRLLNLRHSEKPEVKFIETPEEITRQILDTLAGGQLTDEEIKVLWDEHFGQMEGIAIQPPFYEKIAKAQAIRSNAQHQKEIGELKEELEATYEAYEVVVEFLEEDCRKRQDPRQLGPQAEPQHCTGPGHPVLGQQPAAEDQEECD